MYDITRPETLDRIDKHWLPEYEKDGKDNAILFLIGAKYDLKEERKVSEEDAKKFKTEHNIRKYYETSSLSGYGVDSLFQTMAAYIMEFQTEQVSLKADRITLHERGRNEPGSSKSTCSCQLL